MKKKSSESIKFIYALIFNLEEKAISYWKFLIFSVSKYVTASTPMGIAPPCGMQRTSISVALRVDHGVIL